MRQLGLQNIARRREERQIKEEQLDVSLRRLFTIRSGWVCSIPSMVNMHRLLPARSPGAPGPCAEDAQQSIVLLRNGANTLPLKKTIKKIAVAPNADNKSPYRAITAAPLPGGIDTGWDT